MPLNLIKFIKISFFISISPTVCVCVCVQRNDVGKLLCIFCFLLRLFFFHRINCLSLCLRLRSSALNVYSSLNFARLFVFLNRLLLNNYLSYLFLCPARARIAFVCPELFCHYVIGFSNNITLMITSGLISNKFLFRLTNERRVFFFWLLAEI